MVQMLHDRGTHDYRPGGGNRSPVGRLGCDPVKLIYKPFGLIFGILAGVLSKKLFEALWGVIDREEPPKPTTKEARWAKVLGAAAVQGVTFKVTRAAVDRAGAKSFNYLTGIWPGEKRQERSEAAQVAGR